jgi:hypothetical protein
MDEFSGLHSTRAKRVKPIEKLIEKPIVEVIKEPATIKLISIRSLFPARLKYRGQATGKLYEWAEAGSVVEVQPEDAPYLLSKKLGSHGCCGVKSDGNRVFEQL